MSLALSPDGRYALASYLNGPNQPVIFWDLETEKEMNSFGVPGNPWFADQELHVASVAFLPDGKTALFGLVFGTVIWWDLNKWEPIAMNRLHQRELEFVACSTDGTMSISVGVDAKTDRNAKVKFWRLPPHAGVRTDTTEPSPPKEN
jgi:WD40 repeat protein